MATKTGKIFTNGRSQAVRLPKEFRFSCDEVIIRAEGDSLVLTPKPKRWADYFNTAPKFTESFSDQIDDPAPEDRTTF